MTLPLALRLILEFCFLIFIFLFLGLKGIWNGYYLKFFLALVNPRSFGARFIFPLLFA